MPWLARWLTTDPSGLAGGPNAFEYTRGRPPSLTDRTGRSPDEAWRAIGAELRRLLSLTEELDDVTQEVAQASAAYTDARRASLAASGQASVTRYTNIQSEAREVLERGERRLERIHRQLDQIDLNARYAELETELAASGWRVRGGQEELRAIERELDTAQSIAETATTNAEALRGMTESATESAGRFEDLGTPGRQLRVHAGDWHADEAPMPRVRPAATPHPSTTVRPQASAGLRRAARRGFRRLLMAIPIVDVVYQQVDYENNAYTGDRPFDALLNVTVAEFWEIPMAIYGVGEFVFEAAAAPIREARLNRILDDLEAESRARNRHPEGGAGANAATMAPPRRRGR